MRKYRVQWTNPFSKKVCNAEYRTFNEAQNHAEWLNEKEGFDAIIQSRLLPEWETITHEPDFT